MGWRRLSWALRRVRGIVPVADRCVVLLAADDGYVGTAFGGYDD